MAVMAPQFTRLKGNQISDFINEKLVHKPVGVLFGARQVGKTTLIQESLKNLPHLYLNLERSPVLAQAIEACSNFDEFTNYLRETHQFNPSQKILVIDEAQQSPKLAGFIRFMKEEWENATVILTGSFVSEMYHKIERHPVGREKYFNLWPLSFKEFLMAMEQNSLVKELENFEWGKTFSTLAHERLVEKANQYLAVGGMPEVVKTFIANKNYREVRADIVAGYASDFSRYYARDDINLFHRALSAIAANAGSPSKDTQVVRLDAPGYKKVASIFSRLESWRMVIKSEQLGIEPEKNKFHPKRYLFDVGILADLRLKGLETPKLEDLHHPVLRPPLGGLVENWMALSLANQFSENLKGFRLSSQTEIDFIIKQDTKTWPVECKIAQKFKNNYLSGVLTYLKTCTQNGKGILLYGGPPLKEAIQNCYIIPYYLCDELARLTNSIVGLTSLGGNAVDDAEEYFL